MALFQIASIIRVSTKVDLDEPIRYAVGNPIESWLHKLLCIDATNYISNILLEMAALLCQQ